MAIGDTIRIITEQEHRAMSPPRKPPGEKPATTIRFQRRQIFELGKTIADLRTKLEIHERATWQAQDFSNKMATEADYLEEQMTNARAKIDDLTRQLADTNLHAAYLQGHFDGSTGAHLRTKTVTIRSAGDPPTWSPGEAVGQEGRPQDAIPGLHARPGAKAWRHHALHPTDNERAAPDRKEERTAKDWQVGEARDGTIRPQRVNRTYPLPDGALYRR